MFLLAGVMCAQQPPAAGPPPVECGVHGDLEIICGTHSPEDLELTPDGKYLIVAQFVNGRGGTGAGLALLDLAKKTYSNIAIKDEPKKDWGDPACPGPVNGMLIPHGISLLKTRLYVVNHGGRQSIEMYELKKAGGSWELAWHGCVVTSRSSTMSRLPPTAALSEPIPPAHAAGRTRRQPVQRRAQRIRLALDTRQGRRRVAGHRQGYPNGVLVSPDGKTMYFNAWTAKEVHKYDLKAGKDVGVVKLDFMPDNITWASKGQILAAGVKGARGDCPAGSGAHLHSGVRDCGTQPATWQAKTVFDSQGRGNVIAGVSVALQVGNAIYVGSFQGDRVVRINEARINWKQ